MKRIIATACLLALLNLNGCAFYRSHFSAATQAAISFEASQLEGHVLQIAGQTVDAFAQGESDAQIKNQLVQSAGDALRSMEGTAIPAGIGALSALIEQNLSQWLPAKSHWADFTSAIGTEIEKFVSAHGNNPSVVNQALEIAARALNTKTPPPPASIAGP
jgi:hypothetical protein